MCSLGLVLLCLLSQQPCALSRCLYAFECCKGMIQAHALQCISSSALTSRHHMVVCMDQRMLQCDLHSSLYCLYLGWLLGSTWCDMHTGFLWCIKAVGTSTSNTVECASLLVGECYGGHANAALSDWSASCWIAAWKARVQVFEYNINGCHGVGDQKHLVPQRCSHGVCNKRV